VLSRETINNVLARNNQNGYQREFKRWKFFRAKTPDELWQIDFKGPFTVHGKKYWFLICIDDYSRFLIVAEQFNHEPKTREVTDLLERQKSLPKAILSDHGPQFKEKWKRWCRQHGVEAAFCSSLLSSGQGQGGKVHPEPQQGVCISSKEVPRLVERQTTPIQGVVQPFTVPQRNRNASCKAIRV
jgi:hypothetical protein